MNCRLVAIFTLALFSLSAAQNNPNYSALVDACLTSWKGCVQTSSGKADRAQCKSCVTACGRQDISTPPDGTLCTQLKEHCESYVASPPPPGPTCQSPSCVSYFNRCILNGPKSVDCSYCASACRSCPQLYKKCTGSEPPSVPAGTCPNEGCTYYKTLCERSPGIDTRFCGNCKAACIGVSDCEDEFSTCDKLNV